MAMYAINKQGLRERPSYDELIGYLEYGQEKINYPDRFFKQLRETPQLSNLLDGEGMTVKDLEEQQLNQMKEIQKEHAIQQAEGTAQQLRTMDQKTQTLPKNPVGKKISGMQTDDTARKNTRCSS